MLAPIVLSFNLQTKYGKLKFIFEHDNAKE